VVVGQQDPNPEVNGKGIEFLQVNRVEVVTGIEDEACRWINLRFNAHFEKQRPYIILKWAQSADGFIDPTRANGEKGSIAISSAASRALVQQWRKEEMGIVVGRQTVSVDNPRLTFHADNHHSPIRFVIDPQLQLQPYTQYHIGQCPPNTVVVYKDNQHIDQLPEGMIALPYSNHAIETVLQYCFENGITSILVEGGGHTLQTFIDQDCWDEARIFESPHLLGQGTAAPVWSEKLSEQQTIGDDQLKIYYR
jgi:diaminohydroxyphosphoribosylaminopyrimidine deaminase/5-amino-6-(5-phosphoribosylamino)uracil reductase